MQPQWPSRCSPSKKLCLLSLIASPYQVYAVDSYPQLPDTLACSRVYQRTLGHGACQAAVDNLPRGALSSIFTTRARTATNNYVQVPVSYADAEPVSNCVVTVDMDGHSQNDQFVVVPWDDIREMAQAVVDTCVGPWTRGGFITYGVGRTLESLIHPTAYGANNPTPAWVLQPDDTVEYVAIPSMPVMNEYSKFRGTAMLTGGSECLRRPYTDAGSDVPYYLRITVSVPSLVLDPKTTDYAIALAVTRA